MFAPLPKGPFDLIAADCAWMFKAWSAKGLGRSPERHYKTLTLDQICALPVKDIAARDCHLMLWITGPLLVQGAHLPVLKAWGFKPSSMAFVWLKVNKKSLQGRFFQPIGPFDFFMGPGHTTRQNAEYVVLGRRGSPRRHSKAVRQQIIEPRREHSRKPDEFYERCEEYAGPDARLCDLFSRTRRPGWSVWGNELEKFKTEDAWA
ncbi:MT-A70 family methyltransferase [Hoeflea poritis]|uniref:MT-A70 family methyltransferase n=1 Tax=Hoeflea poritis TaxID=2993659 RepID=A0ABT4VMT7_9HYPH|nr:MT-A70 family methyltransferase [Hoeflea poritis]MDA4845919.1 MT-A70 family methyltransferase [Hoeflea poritis]